MDVAVLGSSLPVEGEPAYAEGLDVGREIARRGARVVCGGYGGVMEAACRGAAEAGGASVGVVLAGRGTPNRFVTETVAAADLAERLRLLRDLPGAWIVLPRGLGTLLELVWIAESIVKGDASPRPLVLLGEFWRAAAETAIREASRAEGRAALESSLRRCATPAEAVAAALAAPSGR
ncbi:MAG TPA: LOG family protein [Thermoanaerobaculia bacterium]